jgi:hypothetical protein
LASLALNFSRQNPQEILRMHVLRTADKARHGLFIIAPLRGDGPLVFL